VGPRAGLVQKIGSWSLTSLLQKNKLFITQSLQTVK
jgi:hypothetical protein